MAGEHAHLFGVAALIVAVTTSGPALAQDNDEITSLRATLIAQQAALDEQRAAIAELTRKLDALSSTSPSSEQPPPETTVSPRRLSRLNEAGGAPSLTLGGYVQIDALHFPDARAGEPEDFLGPGRLNTDGSASGRTRTRLSARDTRLSLEARWPSMETPLRGFVEFDFYGGAPAGAQAQLNGYEPRLRHALIEVGPGRGRWQALVGQTWSAFADPEAFGPFYNAAPFGVIFVRQPQVRYTHWLDDQTQTFLSLENPESEIASGTLTGERFDPAPDLVFGVRIERAQGYLKLAGLLRSVRDDTDSAASWGVALSGMLRFSAASADTLRFQLSAGDGIGRYISDLGPGFDGSTDVQGRIHLRSVAAISASYEHVWSPHWRSSLGVSQVDVGAAEGAFAGRRSRAVTGNVVFSPIERLDLATEVAVAELEDELGQARRATLYRLATRFSF